MVKLRWCQLGVRFFPLRVRVGVTRPVRAVTFTRQPNGEHELAYAHGPFQMTYTKHRDAHTLRWVWFVRKSVRAFRGLVARCDGDERRVLEITREQMRRYAIRQAGGARYYYLGDQEAELRTLRRRT